MEFAIRGRQWKTAPLVIGQRTLVRLAFDAAMCGASVHGVLHMTRRATGIRQHIAMLREKVWATSL